MATATKSVRSKSKKVTARVPTAPEEIEGLKDADVDTTTLKVKKVIDIDEPEPVVGIEEKPEEDPLVAAAEEAEDAEEIGLDGEELNPFGDRWEE